MTTKIKVWIAVEHSGDGASYPSVHLTEDDAIKGLDLHNGVYSNDYGDVVDVYPTEIDIAGAQLVE